MDQFDNIYKDNYRLIYNVVRKMVSDKDDASDLVQEVFIKLYQSLEKKVIIEYPVSWLYKVTVNKCIDYTKKHQRHEQIELFTHIEEDDAADPNEKQAVIRLAMKRLKEEERMLAILYSEGLSYKEIANITGIRFSSVGKTLSRTLEKLGNELKNLKYDLY